MCIIVHPSLTHYSFTYLHWETLAHTHTHTHAHTPTHTHIHECWYALIHALNTRLDASETHLSPYSCVETILSAFANVYMCERTWSARFQVKAILLLIWLTGRHPRLLPLLPFSPFITHFSFFHPSSWIRSSVPFTSSHLFLPVTRSVVQSSRCFSVSCLSSSPPSFLLLFIILPPSCLTLDDINTSFCLRRDRITCGNTAYNHSTSAIRKCVCVCGNSSMHACVKMCPEWSKLMESEAQRLSSHWWKCCSGLESFHWNYYSHI